jgi:lipopolysaccharide export system protein LptC
MRNSAGDNVLTDKAIIDTAHGSMAGQGRVSAWGPMGVLTAESFAVYDQGQRIVFRGEVHSIMKRS